MNRATILFQTHHHGRTHHHNHLLRRTRTSYSPNNSFHSSLSPSHYYSSIQLNNKRCSTPLLSSFYSGAPPPLTTTTTTATRHYHSTTPSTLSDNLLGHSPMARPTPNNQPSTTTTTHTPQPISPFGVDSNTTGGGIWEQTSSKKTKLNELLTELTERGIDTGLKGMDTLDDAAVGEERLDLELVEGLKVLVQIVDQGEEEGGDSVVVGSGDEKSEVVNVQIEQDAEEAIAQLFKLFDTQTEEEEEWTKYKLESKMKEAIRILSEGSLPNVVDEKQRKKHTVVAGSLDVSHPFCYLRQFMVADDTTANMDIVTNDNNNNNNNNNNSDLDPILQQQISTLNTITQHALKSSTILYRTLLLRATAQTILDNWDQLTTITSGDIDRAAISKIQLPPSGHQRDTINSKCVRGVFEAYASKSPQEWVQSWWRVLDADNDGLIDQEEMNICVDLTLAPVHLALGDVFDITLGVCPVRTIGLGGEEEARRKNAWFLGVDNDDDDDVGDVVPTYIPPAKLSWRNRRKEMKQQKILRKAFQGTIARHFRDQAEAPHRLRCIYAWAEKEHQENKLDSVLVDASEDWGSGAASAVMGRKRYVELEPKISYEEFREVQKKTFPHLDRIGEEIITSFKEDLWLLQGTKRQNKELKRDGLLFLLGISIVDLGIAMV